MPLKPVYYIFGSDDYLAEEALNEIKAEALTGPFASMNYHVFEGKGVDATEVLSAASTMPAFAEWRVVVVRGAESMKSAQEKGFVEYLKNPSPSTCLVFVSSAAKADRTSPLHDILSQKGFLRACNKLEGGALVQWVRKEAKRQGKDMTEGAVRKLLSIAGDKLRDVKRELDKIITFALDKPSIDERDVEDVGLDCREETIFNLSDAIAAKDLKKALKVYDRVSDEDPLKILGAVSRQMRMLLKVKSLLKKGTPVHKIPSIIGVYQKYSDGYVSASRRFTEGELKSAMGKLLSADTALKTGRVPEPLVIPDLIMELCGAGR